LFENKNAKGFALVHFTVNYGALISTMPQFRQQKKPASELAQM